MVNMYEIKKQSNEGADLFSNGNHIGKIITSFILFMSISVGFGFLLGHFVLPKTCNNCQLVEQVTKTEGNAYIDFVSGTEYISGSGGLDVGQVIIRVTDYKGVPLTATCNATILTPAKAFYLFVQPMTTSTINGNYYTTFSVPSTTGVYEDYVNCSVTLGNITHQVSKSSSFHVSPLDAYFNNISQQIISVNGTCLSVNQTVINAQQYLNNSITWSHDDIIANLNSSSYDINATLTQIINDMATYYSNLNMQINGLNTTVVNAKTEILNAIESSRSDIEIIKEWLGDMFGKITPTSLPDTGQSWFEKIIGRDVNLPDIAIPRPQ